MDKENEKEKKQTVQVLVDGDLAQRVRVDFANGRGMSLTSITNHLLDMLSKGMVGLQALNPNKSTENK